MPRHRRQPRRRKGIAQKLGSAGATVYVTGAQHAQRGQPIRRTVFATAEEVTRRGGKGIAIACDHKDDAVTQALRDEGPPAISTGMIISSTSRRRSFPKKISSPT